MSDDLRTDFVVSRGDYLIGAGSVMNLAGDYFLYSVSPTPKIADLRASKCDWGMVGKDINDSIKKAEKGQFVAAVR